jgi:hypothetical protein
MLCFLAQALREDKEFRPDKRGPSVLLDHGPPTAHPLQAAPSQAFQLLSRGETREKNNERHDQ